MSNEDIIEDVRTGEDLLIFNLGLAISGPI